MAFTLDKAELVSLLVEAVLYGLYVFLFSCTIYVLLYKRTTARVSYGMLTVTILLFVFATAHLVTNFFRLLEAFHLSQSQPRAAFTVLGNQADFKNLLRNTLLLAEILVGDVVLIYRCYVAWGNSLRVTVLPLVVLMGTGVTSGGVLYSFAKPQPGTSILANHRAQSFIIATQVLVLVNNLICTGLLTWKLWRMSRAMVSRAQRHSLRSVARIITESGLITALTWLLFIVTNAVRTPAQFIVLNSLAPITGGSFCLLISRIALGIENEDDLPRSDAIHHRGDTPTASVLPVLDGTGRPHRPMEISVSSRHSVRIETEMDLLEQDKKALASLAFL